jgi:MFS family permease
VLATTHSPAQAGLVAFARLTPSALFGLVSGAAADRTDRRRLMIGADALRGVALGALAAALVVGDPPVSAILLVAFIEGTGATVFGDAEPGALRAVVPAAQLADAAGAQEAARPDDDGPAPEPRPQLDQQARSSARSLTAAIVPLGPLTAGVLLSTVSPRATVAVFAGLGLALAVWGTLSPAIRRRRAWTSSRTLPPGTGIKGPRPRSDVWSR